MRSIEENEISQGLKVKYNVTKIEGGGIVNDCFVLRPDKDPAAKIALMAYAKATRNKELAIDILKWVGNDERCVVLPCKVGDMVYVDQRTLSVEHLWCLVSSSKIINAEIISIRKTKTQTLFKVSLFGFGKIVYRTYPISAIGKTVFLKIEDAKEIMKDDRSK